MGKRVYNVLFHLHTISGIIISALLFVIFFAGSFAFFRDEIVNWEKNHSIPFTENIEMDYNEALASLEEDYNLYGRDVTISKYYVERKVGINLTASKDTAAADEAKTAAFFYLDIEDYETADYVSSYSLGEFLYRLHFFAQIPHPYGYYLSGLVAFFFLFAIITGILVHWKKIVSNFYVFRPWSKIKSFWTDAHTALGTIGLPFQFVYAVTGAFFMIKAILIAPSVFLLYDGDEAQLYDDLGYGEPSFVFENRISDTEVSINGFVAETREDWENFSVNHVHIFNYGDENMHVSVEGETERDAKFTGPGKKVFKASNGEVVSEKNPYAKASYLDGVKNSLYRLHYGDYGGYALKIVSFILGLISCYVIISGVMIWLVARDKKNVPDRKRRFNEWLVNIYLGICLSMYPVTAAAFIAVKAFSLAGISTLYPVYFIMWLVASVFFIVKKDNFFTNKYTLMSGSILGFLIPVVNGIVTGNWIWVSFMGDQFQPLFIDLLWIILSALTLYTSLKVKPMTGKEEPTRIKRKVKTLENHQSKQAAVV